MAKKNKVRKYSVTNLLFVLLSALSVLSAFLPYVSGDAPVSPISFLNGELSGALSIFGIMYIVLKLLPALCCFVVQLFPMEVIKGYLVTFFIATILAIGEALCFVITTQRFEGGAGIGFIAAMAVAIVIAGLCILFTKTDNAPKKHKDITWYRGINKIIVLIEVPICAAMTAAIILFCTLVFRFPFAIVLGIMSIWGCLTVAGIVSVGSLFGKYKLGILYYLAAFLNVLGVAAICWSDSVSFMLLGLLLAALIGAFWFGMAGVAKKYF